MWRAPESSLVFAGILTAQNTNRLKRRRRPSPAQGMNERICLNTEWNISSVRRPVLVL
jgi:hypothetical protein